MECLRRAISVATEYETHGGGKWATLFYLLANNCHPFRGRRGGGGVSGKGVEEGLNGLLSVVMMIVVKADG